MKPVVPRVGGALIFVSASICVFFAVWIGGAFAQPYGLVFMVGPGVLAFVLGLTAGRMSLLGRHFWVAVICGGLSLVPAFWVFLVGFQVLVYMQFIRFPIWAYLLATALAPAVIGLVLVAQSKKEFSKNTSV